MSKKSNIRIVREQIANFPLKSMVSQIWFDPAQVCLETPKSFNNFFRFIFELVMKLFEIKFITFALEFEFSTLWYREVFG